MNKFDPHTCQCPECETVLRSSYPGEFVRCECGKSFVDQTEYFSRYGGIVRSLDSLILDDLKAISGVGYTEQDILDFFVFEFNVEYTEATKVYDMPNPLLGGSSVRELVEARRGHKVIALFEALKEGY